MRSAPGQDWLEPVFKYYSRENTTEMSSKINFQEDHTSNSHQASTIFNTDYSTENLIERRHLEKPSRFKSFQNWRQNSSFILVGWKYGVKLGVILTSAILILNLGITLGVVLSRGSDKDGKAELMSAECDTIKKYNTGYHLVINSRHPASTLFP